MTFKGDLDRTPLYPPLRLLTWDNAIRREELHSLLPDQTRLTLEYAPLGLSWLLEAIPHIVKSARSACFMSGLIDILREKGRSGHFML